MLKLLSKLIQTFLIYLLLFKHNTIADYSNLLYGRPLTVFPDIASICGETKNTAVATDRVMTRYMLIHCNRAGYIFLTWPINFDCSLTISLP